MVLAAADELRHPHDDGYNWRESLYFNFADERNGLGGWLYLWVVPNKPMKSGMLVSFYHGITDRRDANELAMKSTGHLYRGEAGNWVYCFKKDIEPLITANFDDVELCGLRLVRRQPLRTYHIEFADDAGTRLDVEGEFAMDPYDYADGAFATPAWVAANRYHRTWRVRGDLLLAGKKYRIDTTGDSDHSWGTRDMQTFSTHTFKMWSFQTPDAKNSVSVIEQGKGLYLGFVNIGGDVRSVRSIEQTARYSKSGVQEAIDVTIRDTADRTVHARMAGMFSVIGHAEPAGLWGYEGVGRYEVSGWGSCTGVTSYFWPPTVSPADLHRGAVDIA
jgi:hypothetical protein